MKATTDSKTPTRPLPAVIADVALLDIRDVVAAVRMSASWVHEEVRAGRFPAPIRYGPRCSRWPSARVRAWLIERVESATTEERGAKAVVDTAARASAAAKAKRSVASATATL